MLLPSHYNIDHDEWRPGQHEAIKWLLSPNRKRVSVVSAPTGAGKCIDVNSIISTPGGLLFADNVKKCIVSFDDFPMNDIVVAETENAFRECVKITTRKGFNLTCTREHKIAVWVSPGLIEWKKAGDISDEDVIVLVKDKIFPVTSRKINNKFEYSINAANLNKLNLPDSWDSDLCYLAGLITGDGYIRTNSSSFKITTPDDEIVKFIYMVGRKFGVTIGKYQKAGGKAADYTFHSIMLRDFMISGGVSPLLSIHKEIPWSIMQGTRIQIVSFLRGLFDTDGGMSGSSIEYGTSSSNLARQVQLLLLKLGIVSTVSRRKTSCHDAYRLYISGYDAVCFYHSICFSIERKKKILENRVINKPRNTNDDIVPNISERMADLWGAYKNKCHQIGVRADTEFAKDSAMSKKTLGSYCRGNRRPSRGKIYQILSGIIKKTGATEDILNLKSIADMPVFFDYVEKLEQSDRVLTKDFQVQKNQNYIANGFLVHNSALSAALGSQGRQSRTLTATRALQSQYAASDGFKELYGMNAYPCALFGQGLGLTELTAEHCVYPANMARCPQRDNCEYLTRKHIVKSANRQSLSYAYFFVSDWAKSDHTDFLFCDEAHNIPDLLMAHYTMEIDQAVAASLEIPLWPQQLKTQMAKWETGRGLVVGYLWDAVGLLQRQINRFPDNPHKMTTPMALKLSSLKGWMRNMKRVVEGLTKNYPYHIEVVDAELRDEPSRGDKLTISPLSARDFFEPAFLDSAADRIVMTSATIGDEDVFGGLLGLTPGDFNYHSVPNRFPPEDMPIYVPVDAPYIRYIKPSDPNYHKKTETMYGKQAELIKLLISSAGKFSSGLVHFSSRRATYDMAERLARMGLQDRIYVTPEQGGTEERMAAYKEYQKRNSGTIHLTWCFWEGYDGYDDNFSIVAKAPYPQETELVKMQRRFDGSNYYNWKTAVLIEQGIGRVRRGDPSHYGKDADKLTAIVDRNALKLTKYFSEHFQECLVTT